MDSKSAVRFLRLKDVVRITGLSRSCVYREVARGAFPAPCRLSERTSAWVSSEVDQWCDFRVASRSSVRGAK